MVRIKGANSDYEYSTTEEKKKNQVISVKPQPEELYLKMFICPYDQPSVVEPNEGKDKCCHGSDSNCPNQGKKQGHALIHLHQQRGIELVTDNNLIIVICD